MLSNSRSKIIVSLIIIGLVFGAVGGFLYMTNPYEPSRIAVIFMAPGFGDFSIADQIRTGMNDLLRDASVSYYIPSSLPSTPSEAENILKQYAARTGYYDLIVAVGNDLVPAVAAVAKDYPSQRFAVIGGTVNADNVASAIFATEQAAFIAGVLAAYVAHTSDYSGVVGVLAAEQGDLTLDPIIYGFRQGVQVANDELHLNITLLDTVYLGGFNETTKAITETEKFFDPYHTNGSVLFAPVRAALKGVRIGLEHVNATWYSNKTLVGNKRMPLVIGAEHNVDYYGNPRIDVAIGPSWIMTSVVPRTDIAFRYIVNRTLWNEFDVIANANLIYNLANNGVNITKLEFSNVYLTGIPYLKDHIKTYQERIINGSIIVKTGP